MEIGEGTQVSSFFFKTVNEADMIATGIPRNEQMNDDEMPSRNLLHLVLRYFGMGQRIGLFLTLTGLAAIITGIYLAYYKYLTALLAGTGAGLILSGWLTVLNGILLNLRSQWNCFAACTRLRQGVSYPPDGNTRFERYLQRKSRAINWLALLFMLLLLFLHFSRGLFWQGCVQAILWMNALNLLCLEYRQYRFSRYWKKLRAEIGKYHP
jgi:hypothetical protein